MRRAPSSVMLVKARGLWCLCVLLVMPLCPRAQMPNGQDLDYLELQSVPGRHLAQAGDSAEQQHPCTGRKAGAAIPGQFVLMFKEDKIESFDQGIASLQRAFSSDGVSAASAGPSTASLPINIITEFRGGSGSGSSSSDGASRRRRLQQGSTESTMPVGLVFTGTDDAAGLLKQVDTVQYVENDVCVKVAQAEAAPDSVAQEVAAAAEAKPAALATEAEVVAAADSSSSGGYSCLPAAQLSSITVKPLPEAVWPKCLTPATRLAWWGERCGKTNTQIMWTAVYAYDAATGNRLPDCIKLRPSSGAPSADLLYWLGAGCGSAPAAVPTMPTWICSDPFASDSCASTSVSPQTCPNTFCIPYGSDVQQTVEIMHPESACSPRKPVKMRFVGERCYGGGTAATAAASIRWLSATPAEPVDNVDTCTMYRKTGSGVDKAIYNQNYFGSCGVPPALIKYLAWGECPPPPPPPSPPPPAPPPPPPPRVRNPLPKDLVGLGSQTVSAGVRRILAVTQTETDGTLMTVKHLPGFQPRVAVMDTGIECGHPDLNIALALSFNNELHPFGKNPGCYDGYGHGTHVAGIIGALNNQIGVIGVMPNTPIVSLKVLNAEGDGTFSDILKAVNWLLSTSFNGTANPGNVTNAQLYQISVLSMSLGFSSASVTSGNGGALCRALQAVLDSGIVPVAAASNDHEPLNEVAPANCPAVIAATSMNQETGNINPQQQASWFTNYLSMDPRSPVPATPEKVYMTIAAPGNSINSTCSIYKDRNGYCSLSGTSQATPHIAGIYSRCFASGACRDYLGAENIKIAIQEFVEYNTQVNTDYGFQQDPIRNDKNSTKYYGYLAWADAY